MTKVLGIVGAGKLGIALARVGLAAGFTVLITSRNLANTHLIAQVMAPGSRVVTLVELAAQADLIVLALPLSRLQDLRPEILAGKIVVDAINYWQPVDGDITRFKLGPAETSRFVQGHLVGARLVKSLNQLGYHDVEDRPRPLGALDRLGVAMAGDDPEAVALVGNLVDQLGFDPVLAGSLADGVRLGPGGAAFGATLTANELREAIGLVPANG